MEINVVKDIAVIYERVKHRNTGQARIIIGRKNPEDSKNYSYIEDFCERCVKYDIIPNFYFESLYSKGKKVVPTSPECKMLNKKTNKHWYMTLLKEKKASEAFPVVKAIDKTANNIDMFIADNDFANDDSVDFFNINPLDRLYPDWVLMLKAGLISPYFLFMDDTLLPYIEILQHKEYNRNIGPYREQFDRLNKDGKVKELLDTLFGDLLKRNNG